MRDLTQHLTTRADDSHAAPVQEVPCGKRPSLAAASPCQVLVRFCALLRIKPHAPPLVRAPVNSFEFQPCGRNPRRCAYRVSYDTEWLGHPTSSTHRLRRGLPGYQSCLLPTLSRLSVSNGPGRRLRHRCSSQYLRISPLHWEFHDPLPHSSLPVSSAAPRLSPGISRLTNKPPTRPLRPVIPSNASPLRITAAAGTKLAGASSAGTVIIVPAESALQSEDLLHTRGIAGSGLRPLSNIPHCCLP